MRFLEDLGRYLILMRQVFHRPEKYNMYWKEIMRQMNDIGVGSLPIVFSHFHLSWCRFGGTIFLSTGR